MRHLTPGDWILVVLFACIGLWPLLCPKGVMKFMQAFNGGKSKGTAKGVQFGGALWIAFVLASALFSQSRW